MNVPDTRTGHMDVFLPRAMAPAVLDAVIRLHITSALARTGTSATTIEYGTGQPHSPGVTRWPVTYTTDTAPPD
ncbi:hypothetical protein C5E45_25595 [Nocardia nova]|uniref:Uncharacterized protein n=1 Tax=Nocardia nova TaxID=37330 RepID=A0A2S6AJQ0_9NOCA|nr:hypothetical protein [Nocardia nova]PPJ35446.1 hypothetical protein C5E45_25595 [Nocardia nova]